MSYDMRAVALGFTSMRASPREIIYATPPQRPMRHTRARLAAPVPTSRPALRASGSSYRKTGFIRPVRASVQGIDKLPLRVLKSATPMPDNFCWQPQDLVNTVDQGDCGSCWAQSLASVLADVVSAKSQGAVRTSLSAQQIMECSAYVEGAQPVGCEGNDPYTAIGSLQSKTVPILSAKDYPRKYTASNCSASSCVSAAPEGKYYVTVKSAFVISEPIAKAGDGANLRNIENMKQHIYNEGPIIGTFMVYSDFMDYDGKTIYEPSADALSEGSQGGHAIELIGWGKDPVSGTSYWIGRNSWGSNWPAARKPCTAEGTFYFRMGNNTCEIEAYSAGATTEVHNASSAVRESGANGSCASQIADKLAVLKSPTGMAVAAAFSAVAVGGAVYYVIKKRNPP